ncbi:DNA mismatch repair endonuclease MutL [Paenibacillus polymyxa]|uniref:DNA mismatch repair endonuclease MutL n=1 Tax=Paenibacillus polymyxa TaxID=1406 RepID=UPI0025B6DA7C|nr:DNA mismatch repair endonuclease MutL [Paenibacillus polymyxa]MDN4081972.1 DNA mismatch repair endonuclease MutL [Paenibacillus polymyxa]MDN4087850.1 DNA mismatch repair endonuclease MutL [Paenibacillus polymyxa]MDN4107303.1 DNA mismatch repair endonuclease MutL [Paenibacillus polymyxa]
MSKIRVLDEHIANQIAAGEVVERPASVVKELVENAIDAGGTRVDVWVEEGGLQSIRVTDNGSGIEPEDVETAFYRHATSKIGHGRDLFQITSLGFRGEALPSIAAVSKVELLTAAGDDGRARKLVIEGGKLVLHEDAAGRQGTDFTVRDLFYNTPARLKYMKTIQTELGHISDVLYRMALSHPEVAFTLRHNGNTLLQTLGNGDLLQVIAAIYGTSAAKSMLMVEGESLDYRISGYVSRPEWTRSNRNAISTVVNGRFVRSYGLNQALLKAYHTLLPINRYPLAVIQLDMHPSLVDVNVHPAKLEVRFSKEAELFQLVEDSVKAVLGQQVLIPKAVKREIGGKDSGSFVQEQFHFSKGNGAEVDASSDNGHNRTLPLSMASPQVQESTQSNHMTSNEEKKKISQEREQHPSRERSHLVNGQANTLARQSISDDELDADFVEENNGSDDRGGVSLSDGTTTRISTGDHAETDVSSSYSEGIQETAASAAYRSSVSPIADNTTKSTDQKPHQERLNTDQLAALSGAVPEVPTFPELNLIGQHHGTYLIAQNDQGLYLIDQHAAHERVNYEFYYEKFGNPESVSQELLLPITLEFTPSETEKLKTRLHWFEQAGVYLEHFGGQTFRVSSYPYWLPKGEEADVIEEMAGWVLEEKAIDLAKLREAASIMCSCRASIKANQKLTDRQAVVLLERLAACKQPYTCPHGRPIVVSFSTYDLEKLFKRVM